MSALLNRAMISLDVLQAKHTQLASILLAGRDAATCAEPHPQRVARGRCGS
jgi:hypothetical protein